MLIGDTVLVLFRDWVRSRRARKGVDIHLWDEHRIRLLGLLLLLVCEIAVEERSVRSATVLRGAF